MSVNDSDSDIDSDPSNEDSLFEDQISSQYAITKSASSSSVSVNPTWENFITNTPVAEKLILRVEKSRHGGNFATQLRLLDRQARAICRLLFSHGKNPTEIAFIFRVSTKTVKRAINNAYAVHDDISMDYKYLSKEFQEKFPAQPLAEVQKLDKKRKQCPSDDDSDSDLELLDQPSTSTRKFPTIPLPSKKKTRDLGHSSTAAAKKTRNINSNLNPHSSRTSGSNPSPSSTFTPTDKPRKDPPPTSSSSSSKHQQNHQSKNNGNNKTVRKFLADIRGFDLSSWQNAFIEQGLDTESVLLTMAKWDEKELDGALSEMFPTMKAIQRIALRRAILGLV